MVEIATQVRKIIKSIDNFTRIGSSLILRSYQCGPLDSILDSVLNNKGLSFVIIFPRQSGKNELQAQLQAYLLTLFSQSPVELVSVSPTWKPQAENAMFRLESVLSKNLISRHLWSKHRGYIYQANLARIYFLSGSPSSNIVGTTANLLLSIDEAQDIDIDKYDKDIAPMAASTNATRVFWGTAWTSNTLLAREEKNALNDQLSDGITRVWRLNCDHVAAEVPSYGRFVSEQVRKLGRNHPLVRTQYYSEDIDAEGGLFPQDRIDLMYGSHPPLSKPATGFLYVSALDVAGEDESGQGINSSPSRDATALTIAQVDLSTLQNPAFNAPTYKIVYRQLWTGVKYTDVYSTILDIFSYWNLKYIVCDATGIGAGLVSFLTRSLGSKIIPFIFSIKSKSDLAWSFLSLIDSGRFKDYSCSSNNGQDSKSLQDLFFKQLTHCQYEIVPGPDKRIKWGVPEGTRDLTTGDFIHDDLLFSAAMLSVLDAEAWSLPGPTAIVQGSDPLDDMKEF